MEVTHTTPSFWKLARTWGLYTGLAIGIVSAVSIGFGSVSSSAFYNTFIWLLFVGGHVMAVQTYKRESSDGISLAKCFSLAIAMCLFVVTIEAAVNIIMLTFVRPDYLAELREFITEEIARSTNYESAQKAMRMPFMRIWFHPATIVVSGIFNTFTMAAIVSLIVGLILRTRKRKA